MRNINVWVLSLQRYQLVKVLLPMHWFEWSVINMNCHDSIPQELQKKMIYIFTHLYNIVMKQGYITEMSLMNILFSWMGMSTNEKHFKMQRSPKKVIDEPNCWLNHQVGPHKEHGEEIQAKQYKRVETEKKMMNSLHHSAILMQTFLICLMTPLKGCWSFITSNVLQKIKLSEVTVFIHVNDPEVKLNSQLQKRWAS